MSIGCLLLAAGVYFFKIPNGFVTGGVSGIGIILGKLTRLTPGEWVWILHIGKGNRNQNNLLQHALLSANLPV